MKLTSVVIPGLTPDQVRGRLRDPRLESPGAHRWIAGQARNDKKPVIPDSIRDPRWRWVSPLGGWIAGRARNDSPFRASRVARSAMDH